MFSSRLLLQPFPRFSILSSKSQIARLSSFVLRNPSSSAPRLVPTPLVFVSATGWDKSSSSKWLTVLAEMFTEKGFTTLDADLPSPGDFGNESTSVMQHFESELQGVVRSSFIPFPPVIFAQGAACLIAQTYISSHPATGLVLISPPSSNESVSKYLLPTSLPEFDFEPKFPLAIMATPQEMDVLQTQNRLAQDPGVDRLVVGDVQGQEAFLKIEQWLDEIGV